DAGPARNDVDMQVKHHLAAGVFVELLDGDAVGVEHLHGGPGDLLYNQGKVSEIVGGDVEDVARGRFGQNERVAGRARHDVEEGERLIGLVDLVAGQLAAQDLGKDVVGIVVRHCWRHPFEIASD